MASFSRGFDRLVALRPQEIQVGILKRLRGTPIVRHDAEWAMIYSPQPPYEILRTRLVDFPQMQRLRAFARFWNLVGNSGHFRETLPLLWDAGASPFASFLAFTDWLYPTLGRRHSIALATLAENLFNYLIDQRRTEKPRVIAALSADWTRSGHREALSVPAASAITLPYSRSLDRSKPASTPPFGRRETASSRRRRAPHGKGRSTLRGRRKSPRPCVLVRHPFGDPAFGGVFLSDGTWV